MDSKTLTATLTSIAIVAVGVMVAGYVMYQLRDVELIASARNGFDV